MRTSTLLMSAFAAMSVARPTLDTRAGVEVGALYNLIMKLPTAALEKLSSMSSQSSKVAKKDSMEDASSADGLVKRLGLSPEDILKKLPLAKLVPIVGELKKKDTNMNAFLPHIFTSTSTPMPAPTPMPTPTSTDALPAATTTPSASPATTPKPADSSDPLGLGAGFKNLEKLVGTL